MRLLLSGAAALTFLAAGAAHADETSWSGLYVGAHAGWTNNKSESGERVNFDTNLDGKFGDTVNTAAGANAFSPGFCGGAASGALPASGCSDDDDNFEFGARLGYDWRVGDFIVGPVVEVSRTEVKDSVAAFSTTPAQYTLSRNLKGVAALRLRGGYVFGEDNMIYATGGVAVGDVEHRFGSSNTVNTFVARNGDDPTGYQLGGGYERKIAPEVTVGLEYMYTSLDDGNYRVRAQGPAPATNPFILVNGAGTDFQRSSNDLEFHSVRVTANYRF